MPIDHFTCWEFEAALPRDKETGEDLWKLVGIDKGEYVYHVPIQRPPFKLQQIVMPQLTIIIRSSIKPDGDSAGIGEDSIRCWIEGEYDGQLYGVKLARWITRVNGWQGRLQKQLRILYRIGLSLKPCQECKKCMKAFKVKKTENKGRIFQKCMEKGCGRGFEWINLPDLIPSQSSTSTATTRKARAS